MSDDSTIRSTDSLYYEYSDIDVPITETLEEVKQTSGLCFNSLCHHIYRFLRLDALEDSLNDLDSLLHEPEFHFSHGMIVCRDLFKEGAIFQLLSNRLTLRRERHEIFLKRHITDFPGSLFQLDSSQPWILYWIVHSLCVLYPFEVVKNCRELDLLRAKVPTFLDSMLCCNGGFGGGAGQLPHLATTYAALASLVELQLFDYLNSLNRDLFTNFIASLRDQESGGFFVHKDGEIDIRGAYCAASIATILNLDIEFLFDGIEHYVKSLQAFDGGLSGSPGQESHGGYTYCGLGCLALVKKAHVLDLDELLFWTVQRQTLTTGGFQGRTNKLHDSCYSFWCGAIFGILAELDPSISLVASPFLFNPIALQMYILGCCQENVHEPISKYTGGLRDKPESFPDLYHTCYGLSGLAIAQTYGQSLEESQLNPTRGDIKVQKVDVLLNITEESWGKWLAARKS